MRPLIVALLLCTTPALAKPPRAVLLAPTAAAKDDPARVTVPAAPTLQERVQAMLAPPPVVQVAECAENKVVAERMELAVKVVSAIGAVVLTGVTAVAGVLGYREIAR